MPETPYLTLLLNRPEHPSARFQREMIAYQQSVDARLSRIRRSGWLRQLLYVLTGE